MRPHRRQAAPRPVASRPALQPRVASVAIVPEPFGQGFDVHTPPGAKSAEFGTIVEARAYADKVAAQHGWIVEDKSEVA